MKPFAPNTKHLHTHQPFSLSLSFPFILPVFALLLFHLSHSRFWLIFPNWSYINLFLFYKCLFALKFFCLRLFFCKLQCYVYWFSFILHQLRKLHNYMARSLKLNQLYELMFFLYQLTKTSICQLFMENNPTIGMYSMPSVAVRRKKQPLHKAAIFWRWSLILN